MIITYEAEAKASHLPSFYGTIDVWPNWRLAENSWINYSGGPSDCLWIVPGTIDPMED